MKLFIMRHGSAEDIQAHLLYLDSNALTQQTDLERHLAEEGTEMIEQIGEFLKERGTEFDLICCSPAKRTMETAQVIAQATDYEDKIKVSDYLAPNSCLENMLKLIKFYEHEDNVLFVSHQPLVGKLMSHLLSGQESEYKFKKGSCCCIKMNTPEQNELKFFITPKEAKKLI